MRTAPSVFPALQSLTAGLQAIFRASRWTRGAVTVMDREPNVYSSTFPSEILTCRLPDGSERRLFCKYTAGRSHSEHGHRGDVAYEAEVYRHVLQGLPLALPAFYGAFADAHSHGTWLVLEYLEDSMRVSKVPKAHGMRLAAAWAGRFHALNQSRLKSVPLAFLRKYGADYYVRWSRRTLQLTEAIRPRPTWLRTVCARYKEKIPLLIEQPPTIIHGEYTPHNVLWHEDRVVPIDWESAAVASGEIDLAILLEGWDEATTRACESSYRQARWPAANPSFFQERLDVARLYVSFRWLTECSGWTAQERPPQYLHVLHELAQRLGFL